MQVELVTIGEELLLGYTVDTNAAYLSRALAGIGVRVVRRSTVGDGEDEIAIAVEEAIERTGAVITTGGLGPTSDDATKPAVARVFGRELYLDENVLRGIEERFRRYGWRGPMPASNRQQAVIPAGAKVIPNAHGSAPGIWIEDDRGRWVAMLPGVPRELRGVLEDELLPRLRARAGKDSAVVMSRTLRTTGIGESALADRLGELARAVEGIPVAYLPGWEGVDLRLTVTGHRAAEAATLLNRAADRLRAIAGDYVYGEDTDDLAALVLNRCRESRYSIATAESCTGGLLGARLTEIPGSSEVYLGGVVAYANAAKLSMLEVAPDLLARHGAVSGEVAVAMATAIRERFGATIGISITGVAGPGGGTAEKPVGLVWAAVAWPGEHRSLQRMFAGDRPEIRHRATQAALDTVLRLLDPTIGSGIPQQRGQ